MNLKNLSQLLGLSQTTVSRALNNYPEVSKKTRQKVLKAAKQYGYKANHAARNLAKGKAGAIGHIIPYGTHNMINPHFLDFLGGIGKTYSKLGLDLVMSINDSDSEMENYIRLAKSKRVDGFVLHGPLVNDQRIKMLLDLKLPFVAHGRCFGTTDRGYHGYSWLDVDNLKAFDDATAHLVNLGHTKIALLNGLEHMNFAYLRRKGFEKALKRKKITINDNLMFSQDMTDLYGYTVAMQLLSQVYEERPTAILTASRIIAEGVQRAVKDCKLQIPKDISLMTYDDELGFLPNSSVNVEITCMRSSIYKAGVRVGEMIGELLSNSPPATLNELWIPEMLQGKSTDRIPKLLPKNPIK